MIRFQVRIVPPMLKTALIRKASGIYSREELENLRYTAAVSRVVCVQAPCTGAALAGWYTPTVNPN